MNDELKGSYCSLPSQSGSYGRTVSDVVRFMGKTHDTGYIQALRRAVSEPKSKETKSEDHSTKGEQHKRSDD